MTSWQLRRTIWEALWVSSLLAMSSSQVLSLICFRSWFFSKCKDRHCLRQPHKGMVYWYWGISGCCFVVLLPHPAVASSEPEHAGGCLHRQRPSIEKMKGSHSHPLPDTWVWFFLTHWVSITCEYESAPNTLKDGKISPFPGTCLSMHYS